MGDGNVKCWDLSSLLRSQSAFYLKNANEPWEYWSFKLLSECIYKIVNTTKEYIYTEQQWYQLLTIISIIDNCYQLLDMIPIVKTYNITKINKLEHKLKDLK